MGTRRARPRIFDPLSKIWPGALALRGRPVSWKAPRKGRFDIFRAVPAKERGPCVYPLGFRLVRVTKTELQCVCWRVGRCGGLVVLW